MQVFGPVQCQVVTCFPSFMRVLEPTTMECPIFCHHWHGLSAALSFTKKTEASHKWFLLCGVCLCVCAQACLLESDQMCYSLNKNAWCIFQNCSRATSCWTSFKKNKTKNKYIPTTLSISVFSLISFRNVANLPKSSNFLPWVNMLYSPGEALFFYSHHYWRCRFWRKASNCVWTHMELCWQP